MRRQLVALALVAGVAGVITIACGGGNISPQRSFSGGTGSLVLFGGDAPLCNVVSFTVTITGAALTPQNGDTPVSVISSDAPVTVDFAALMDFETLLSLTSAAAGTYSQITLTLASPEITVLDVKQTPPSPVKIPTSLTASEVTVNITPPLNISNGGSAGLELDFNLLKSVQTDANGDVTGTVTPVFEAHPKTPSGGDGFGELDDLKGIVKSVTTTSNDPAFTGSFTLETVDGRTLTVNVTAETKFEDVSGLSGLVAGATFVEVKAFVDSNGNIVAKEVEAEDEGDKNDRRAAFVGLITSVTEDSQGNATQFGLFVREEHPDLSNIVPPKTSLLVNINSNTRFKVTAGGTNRANLRFEPAALTAGQSVVVHGKAAPGTPPTLEARAVFLRLQSIVGQFANSPAPVIGSDGKTGGFALIPCSSLFGGNPITVFTFSQTAFPGVAGGGLSGLDPKPTLVVKGLLFSAPTSITVNGISVTPPATVDVAKQVHQLQ